MKVQIVSKSTIPNAVMIGQRWWADKMGDVEFEATTRSFLTFQPRGLMT